MGACQFGSVVAIATRKGHFQKIRFMGHTENLCLLTQQVNFFHKVEAEFRGFEGCYLYILLPPNEDNDDDDFNNDGVIVRTGKVVSGVSGG